ncbi:T6SS phospholipase effector Tle1-like catalytic domain-containing protein [Aquabacterium sp. UBA2148]|uniref:T6SS phospholipase effector Tle1-like catalytic domain-containing protein n=1 Tax=Aquabacterium sp. UBA2148 TaxID=1946042 RepID=UPI00257FE527|nr:DUF2235 domain-containing protein [Aquabacterium sp. UBA2148]
MQSIKNDAQRASSRGAAKNAPQATPVADCQQEPWLTFYFDGTGNNEEIDAPTHEHSNVARLYRARKADIKALGHMSFYIPGIGTPFREIGDKGGNWKSSVGLGGQARLDWAWRMFQEQVAAAAARANNPVNKIRMIHLAVFGFSRGAALARAFAVKLQQHCDPVGAGWVTKQGRHPIRLYFMGLFDTVASVGVPTAARKYQAEAAALTRVSPWLAAVPVWVASNADGHASWASDLRIPAMSLRCVHHIAAHEIRNSFPLDTLLEAGRYPPNTVEVVYPGVHSNVGGGYRPGEGGRLSSPFGMLSAIPLQAMYDEAYKAGVPLRSLDALKRAEDPVIRDFYPSTKEEAAIRQTLIRRFNHYMKAVGQGAAPVGQMVAAHMKLYFRWRIIDVGRKRLAAQKGEQDQTAKRLSASEAKWSQERAAKQSSLDKVEYEALGLELKAHMLNLTASGMFPGEQQHEFLREAQKCRQRAATLREQAVPIQASLNTMPSSDGSLLKNMAQYDREFMQESQRVLKARKDSLKGFDRLLREAWDEPVLRDLEVIAFFDDHVIDSLASFAMDRTRATEARVLYQGKDARVTYAKAQAPGHQTEPVA